MCFQHFPRLSSLSPSATRRPFRQTLLPFDADGNRLN